MKRQLQILALVAVVAASWTAAGAAPRKVMAVLDEGWREDFFPVAQTVSYYDVTSIDQPGYDLTANRMFSAWIGYESAGTANWEDSSAMTFNPANGDTYVAAFDSGTGGSGSGDTSGDYDLYKIDYQTLLADWETNTRPMGTMYVPSVGPDGFQYETFGIGHPGQFAATTVHTTSISKVGEVARNGDGNGGTGGGDNFNLMLDYVNPARLVAVDDSVVPDASETPTTDHRLVSFERVSTDPNTNLFHTAAAREGGYANAAQSWVTRDHGVLGRDGYLDDNGTPTIPEDDFFVVQHCEPIAMAYVERDGKMGVWIAENDTPGSTNDEISFLYLDALDGGADDLTWASTFRPDDPNSVDPDDGDVDWIRVDGDGNLVWGESGFWNTTQHEPQIARRQITSYDGATFPIEWTGDSFVGPIAPSNDDSALWDGRFAFVDPETGNVYLWDPDGSPDFIPDLVVVDPSGNIVFEQVDAGAVEGSFEDVGGPTYYDGNHRLLQAGSGIFVRGDLDGDGQITKDDLALLTGGVTPGSLEAEEVDLTGDFDVDPANDDDADAIALVWGLMELPDCTLDGNVSVGDLGVLAGSFGTASGAAFTDGDFTGDGAVTIGDIGVFAAKYGQSLPDAVPEPATMSLLSIGAVALLRRRK